MEHKNISVGLLRSGGKPGNKSIAMSWVGKNIGVDVYFFSIDDVDVKNKKISALKLDGKKWINEIIDYPLVIDNDLGSMRNKEAYADLSENCYLLTQVLGGKLKTLNLLRDNNLFTEFLIPQCVIRKKNDFLNFLENHHRSVLKPVRGSQGAGIYFITVENDSVSINFEGTIRKIGKNELGVFYDEIIKGKNFIIQKYIQSTTVHGAPFDIRIHVQRDGNNEWDNTKTYVRVGTGEEMTANLATGGGVANIRPFIRRKYKDKANEVFEKLNKITKELPVAFQSFYKKDIDSLGIDLGADDDGNLWIFEINSFPGSKFFEFERAMVRMEYLKYLHERESKNNSIEKV